eukprot:TRINITY_DN103539_c0_g1_i1.p1 TRINITY_DN103539_c0_g1~~TRINITY_DN103539_c0_g1_i1.p1  ORF type:complete len:326 (-),score=57.70 TRINITY_DN103539_c0_g1_i1:108-1085(-)
MPLGTLKKFFPDKGFGFIAPDEPGSGDIFAPARNLIGSDESKIQQGLRVTFESEVEARTNKMKATSWSILEGALAAALPSPNAALATAAGSSALGLAAAGGYGPALSYIDLQRYSPYGLPQLQPMQLSAGFGAIPGALPGTFPGALIGVPGFGAAAPAHAMLPPGWEQATDAATGKVYYANRSTGESSWTPPAAAGAPAPGVATAGIPGLLGAGPFGATGMPALMASSPAMFPGAVATALPAQTLGTEPTAQIAPGIDPAASVPAGTAPAAGDPAVTPADAAAGTPATATAELPAGWEQGVDAGSGKTYYFNRATGQSSWTVPLS